VPESKEKGQRGKYVFEFYQQVQVWLRIEDNVQVLLRLNERD